MNEFDKLRNILYRDFSSILVDQELKFYENKLKRLQDEFLFLRARLYEKTKIMFLPEWLIKLNYKDELIDCHDSIIAECTGRQPCRLNEKLLNKLNENYKKNVPFFIQYKFFQMLKLRNAISMDDILAYFDDIFISNCREIYKKFKVFEKACEAGKINFQEVNVQ